jgi:hypothetical protein
VAATPPFARASTIALPIRRFGSIRPAYMVNLSATFLSNGRDTLNVARFVGSTEASASLLARVGVRSRRAQTCFGVADRSAQEHGCRIDARTDCSKNSTAAGSA